jgi:hypothetical protein
MMEKNYNIEITHNKVLTIYRSGAKLGGGRAGARPLPTFKNIS